MENKQKETMETKCYREIKERIKQGYYPPGTRLIETEISKEMNISRTPVRKAIAMLAADGFIENADYRGAVVKNSIVTKEHYLEMLDIISLFLKQAIRRIETKQIPFEGQSLINYHPEFDWCTEENEIIRNRKFIRHLILGILTYLKNDYYKQITERFFIRIEQFADQEVVSIINLSSNTLVAKLKVLVKTIQENRFEEAICLIDELSEAQILAAFR